ncbi:LytR C-terminal domain-containing protein [Streptomyces albus]|uniref:LytR C-terminal domain-containing protein n=1 Tax=Streptomyces albus TaxID=1888 RepID=UPI0037907D03
MSMLTPPGLGGKYRIKGSRYPRMRRPRRRGRLIATTGLGVLTCGVLGWGTLQLVDIYSGADEPPADGAHARPADCASPAAADPRARAGHASLPAPGTITVNVLNATSRTGLAKDTAEALEKRGFRIGEVANAPAPLDGKVKGNGLVIGGPGTATASRLSVLAAQLDGARIRHDAHRDGKDLDLVLGKSFTKLTGKKAAEAALTKLSGPRSASSHEKAGTTC